MTKLAQQVSMNLHDGRLDSQSIATCRQEEWFLEVWGLIAALSVDAYECQLLPDFVEKNVDTKLHLD